MVNIFVSELPKRLHSFIWHFLKPYKFRLFCMLLIACVVSMDRTVVPYILKLIIDKISIVEGDRTQVFQEIKGLLILLMLLCTVLEVLHRISGFIGAFIIPQIQADLRVKMFEYTMSHSIKYFHTNFAGSLSNKIADMANSVHQLITLFVEAIVPILSSIIMSSLLLLSIGYKFALVFVVWFLLHFCVAVFACYGVQNFAVTYSNSRSRLHGVILDILNNVLAVKLFATSDFEMQYISQSQKDLVKETRKFVFYNEKIRLILAVLAIAEFAFAISVAIISWRNSVITLGDLIFILSVTGNMMIMAWWISFEVGIVFENIGICNQALELIKQPHEIVDNIEARDLHLKSGEIVFENVTFGYLDNSKVFVSKNIKINGKEKIGLVGATGSGKSTFVNLILNSYRPDSGRILIDGQDINLVTRESLYKNIAMIPQNDVLFNRSIRENIAYGNIDVSEDELIQVAKKAHCHDFIMKLENGYDTVIGERGAKLSGGQRQLIAIARAIMLKDASIVIMDEATSALDSITDERVQTSLMQFIHNKTAIVIAHRLSTLLNMDRIMVFDDGEVVEEGTHSELMNANGYYMRLWSTQRFLPNKN